MESEWSDSRCDRPLKRWRRSKHVQFFTLSLRARNESALPAATHPVCLVAFPLCPGNSAINISSGDAENVFHVLKGPNQASPFLTYFVPVTPPTRTGDIDRSIRGSLHDSHSLKLFAASTLTASRAIISPFQIKRPTSDRCLAPGKSISTENFGDAGLCDSSMIRFARSDGDTIKNPRQNGDNRFVAQAARAILLVR
jgi:hypothetical protein